ncbi:MAG: hypothetical protein ABSC94_14150 [Polyangiaceae bacterium]|jgi:hypothetical protein
MTTNVVDARIHKLFMALGPGRIRVYEIGQVFEAGRQAHAAGGNVDAAVRAAFAQLTRWSGTLHAVVDE